LTADGNVNWDTAGFWIRSGVNGEFMRGIDASGGGKTPPVFFTQVYPKEPFRTWNTVVPTPAG